MSYRRYYRNEHVAAWLRALRANGGSLLIGAHEQSCAGLYHLGAMWAQERGLMVSHGTVDVVDHEPRRYAYTLTPAGARAAEWIE